MLLTLLGCHRWWEAFTGFSQVAGEDLRCLGHDLYRDYFEDVRQHVENQTLQAGRRQ